jgi:hypothetical protein
MRLSFIGRIIRNYLDGGIVRFRRVGSGVSKRRDTEAVVIRYHG